MEPAGVGQSLGLNLIDRIEELLLKCEAAGAPLELDPQRSGLFELFVMADAAGFLADDSEPDLTSDGVAKELARRWELARAGGPDQFQPAKMPPEQLAKVRLIWSFMRMWMEWTYAWQRWSEFHDHEGLMPNPDA